jgi:hypothetical protein
MHMKLYIYIHIYLSIYYLAVCSGIVTDLLVLVSDVCQINDLAPELFLLCGINLISLCLSLFE